MYLTALSVANQRASRMQGLAVQSGRKAADWQASTRRAHAHLHDAIDALDVPYYRVSAGQQIDERAENVP